MSPRGCARRGLPAGKPLIMAAHPPFVFGPPPPPPRAHGGPLRLLSFGRLLPYKGLDLLAAALARLGPRPDLEVRVVGSGPESRGAGRAAAAARRDGGEPLGAGGRGGRPAGLGGRAGAVAHRGQPERRRRGGGRGAPLGDRHPGRRHRRAIGAASRWRASAIRRRRAWRQALRGLLENPPEPSPAGDPRAAWRGAATALADHIADMLERDRPNRNSAEGVDHAIKTKRAGRQSRADQPGPVGSIQPIWPSPRRYTTFSSPVVVLRNISTCWSARSIRITASLTESRAISAGCSAMTVA